MPEELEPTATFLVTTIPEYPGIASARRMRMKVTGRMRRVFNRYALEVGIPDSVRMDASLLSGSFEAVPLDSTVAQLGHAGDTIETNEWRFYFLIQNPPFPYNYSGGGASAVVTPYAQKHGSRGILQRKFSKSKGSAGCTPGRRPATPR